MPAPIDIASRAQTGQPKSNLTSQLRAAGRDGIIMPNESLGARSGSISQSNGIPMSNARLRRESMVSNDLARSLMGGGGGMSWGGVSVGSWIRDDIIMTGTSPFTFQSPSYHSSSYLPKLEAEFCRDFSCCGIPLPSLHDLLRHYEELHAQQIPIANDGDVQGDNHHEMNRPQSRHPQQQNAGMTSPISGIGGIQYEMMRQQQIQRQRQHEDGRNQDDHQEGEIAGDMEMDDDDMTPPPNTAPMTPQNHVGQQQQMPLTPTSTLGHQSYRNTPNPPNAQLPHLVSQPSHFSPESSVPGTPLATDQLEYGFPQNLAGFQPQNNVSYSGLPFGTMEGNGGDLSLDLCIDEPAKRLFSPGGQAMGGYSQAHIQKLMSNTGAIMPPEDKPFKCPVIGCEKAYKNQNGLKYHKAHGHTNQQLHDNSDGTFSIVNPETSAPYPGTLGMEKEKPYRCEFCGKRYKNLNGLKYHRSHSSHPNVPGVSGQQMVSQQPVPGGVVAVAGGLGETGMGLT
ncbi:hypothetical protein EDC01DRAFT_621581 [Geopyxis carbonaria]|nr:hypothetical protein EDC01DRAFT_621581 [Geopyxis carbonaria]